MTKSFLAALLALSFLLSSADSNAQVTIGGAGIYQGFDIYSVDEQNGQDFLLKDGKTKVNLIREEIENPNIFGGRIYLNILPKTSVELSFDGVANDYEFIFTNVNNPESVKGTGTFLRMGLYATLTRDLVSFPKGVKGLTIYTGAGAGFNALRPALSQEIISSNVDKWTGSLDADEVADINVRATGHGLFGIKIRPSLIPFSIDGGIRYTAGSKTKFNEVDRFFSIYAGVSLRLLSTGKSKHNP